MAIHLRQICLVAGQLDPVVQDLGDTFAIPVCHVDPEVAAFGLENALMAVGSQFLEVVAPVREGTPAGRFLQRRGGDGGYMVICQVPTKEEQAALRQRARDNRVRVAYESDRGSWNIMQLHPGDMGAAFLEVDWDQQGDATGNWQPAGGTNWQDKVCTDRVTGIVGAELQSDDPRALAAHWAAVTGLALADDPEAPTLALANATLRFVKAPEGEAAGLVALDLRVADREHLLKEAETRNARISDNQIILCGTRFNLVT